MGLLGPYLLRSSICFLILQVMGTAPVWDSYIYIYVYIHIYIEIYVYMPLGEVSVTETQVSAQGIGCGVGRLTTCIATARNMIF